MDRNSNFFLAEGMRVGDLADLVLPLLSIDEFESKIDSDAVVVGFYINDEDAADDLNRFIQRSPIDILDTDRSPAPDQNGHYMVFVELLNNAKTADDILHIVQEVSPLCGVDSWEAEIRGEDDIQPLHRDVIKAALERNRQHDLEQKHRSTTDEGSPIKEAALLALRESDVASTICLDNGGQVLLCLRSPQDRLDFNIVAVGRTSTEIERYVSNLAEDCSLSGVAVANRVRRMLGLEWEVTSFCEAQLWMRPEACLVVKALK